jgi:hypothetical protein
MPTKDKSLALVKEKPRKEKPRSSRWATFAEIAAHFCVSEPTVRLGRGVFAGLRRVPLTEHRIVVPRADFERLDREMERASCALDDDGRGKEEGVVRNVA